MSGAPKKTLRPIITSEKVEGAEGFVVCRPPNVALPAISIPPNQCGGDVPSWPRTRIASKSRRVDIRSLRR